MFDLLALAGAIAMVVGVLMLRAMLGLPFARTSTRFVPAAPPAGLGPLFDAAGAELAALGFDAPRWVLAQRTDGGPVTLPLSAVYRNADGGAALLGPPVDVRAPHRPLTVLVHRLADGRLAASQAYDPFLEATGDAALVARTGKETTLAAQWAAHVAFVASLGPTAPITESETAALVFGEERRQALLADGRLRAVTDDLAMPRFGFALRLLRHWLRAPKPPADARPVPPERLALLARIRDVVTHRAPTRGVQWALFAASIALFMAMGAVVWDVQFAVILLVVVLIHELGHFFAMRAFGYRNVHVLALPLVGGVAMGVDANPSATRRAWMSLMGPLPGIVIGWALLAAAAFASPAGVPEWLFTLASVFLFVNYLNVLPIPPLDGAHVVESLLPVRHARLQCVFIGVTAAIGGAVAWFLDFRILTFLAILQIVGLPALWLLHGVERELAASPVPGEARSTQLLRILRALERHMGPATNATQRVTFALQVATRLDTQPMGFASRVVTGAVYALLLAVPVAALALYGVTSLESDETAAKYEARERERGDALAQAKSLSLAELLGPEPRPPATPEQVAVAENRLGRSLPEELRAFYALANGAPELGIGAVEAIVPAADVVASDIEPYTQTLYLEAGDDYVEVPVADARTWWLLGAEEGAATLFWLPDGHARLPGTRVVWWYDDGSTSYASLRDWLAEQRVAQQDMARYAADLAQARAAARVELADADVETLLDAWTMPGVAGLLFEQESPDAAPDDAVAAAAARLGVELPDDLRALYALHDGHARSGIVPVANLARWRDRPALDDDVRTHLFGSEHYTAGDETGGEAVVPTEDDLRDCIVVGARGTQEASVPQLAWCTGGALQGWIDVAARRRHATFRAWLLEEAIPVRAALNAT